MIRLFVGLGNPGVEYANTRHNAGFWFIDSLAQVLGVSLSLDRHHCGLVARVNSSHSHAPLWLLEPMTYMNLSGKSVASLARFFKIDTTEILVVHDELDLQPNQIKLKFGGSHAGHNGLKDIQNQLGSHNFWRLRLGVGHPGNRSEVVEYVLRKPLATDRELIDKNIDIAISALDLLLAGNMQNAIVKIHSKPPRLKTTKLPASPST
jgi:peptidyl-tRNA hydrolase, PTH1 family